MNYNDAKIAAAALNLDGGEGSGQKGHTTEKQAPIGAARQGVLSKLYEHAKTFRDVIDKALGEGHPAVAAHDQTLGHLREAAQNATTGALRFKS